MVTSQPEFCAGLEGEGLVPGGYLCDMRVDWAVALSQC
jgi:hypothetical protein